MGTYFAVVPRGQEELYHYGVKGMKWGIRKSRKKRDRRPTMAHLLESRDPDEIYKYRRHYSDKELQQRLNRLNTEENIYKKTRKAKNWETAKKVGKWAFRAAMVGGPAFVAAHQVIKNKDKIPSYKITENGNERIVPWDEWARTKIYEGTKRSFNY